MALVAYVRPEQKGGLWQRPRPVDPASRAYFRAPLRIGFSRDDIDGAAKALETYIGGRHTTTIGATDPGVLAIADVLTAYEKSKRPKDKNDERAWAQHDLLLIRRSTLQVFR